MTLPTVSVYIATSVDGFIARPDGTLDWLLGAGQGAGEDYGYQGFMASIDVLLLGRKTFATVLSFEHWPYGSRRVVVMSRTPEAVEVPAGLRQTVVVTSAAPRQVLEQLAREGFTHAYLDGGMLIQSFLREGLVDDLTLTRAPVLIGEGVPLFGALPNDVRLHHLATHAYATGFVQTTYTVAR